MTKNNSTVFTAEQKITRAIVWAMRNPNFMSMYPVICVGETKVIGDEGQWKYSPMKTAFTDGKSCFFFREFVDGLTDPELRFVLLHENYHKAYRQLLNWMHLFKQNAQLANMAADYRVNADIMAHGDADVKMPEMCLYDAKYADPSKWDVGRIFKDIQKNGGGGQCSGNCKQGQDSGQANGQCTCPQGFDVHDWGAASELSPEEQRLLGEEIDQAIRQGQRLAGQLGGNRDLAIDQLLKVKTDYKTAFREWMRTFTRGADETSWARVNRRGIANGELMPGTLSEAMGEMAIWCDVSGSISQHELTIFLSNVALITKTIKPMKITIGFWDTQVHGHQTFLPHQYETLAQSVKIAGGGGTDVSCVPPYMEEHKIHPEVCLILSDGYLFSPPPDFGVPVLWGIIQNHDFVPPSPQKVIYLPDGWTED